MNSQTSSITNSPIQQHLDRLLNSRDYPKTICPSEVARALSRSDLEALGANEWRDLMSTIRERVWEMRDVGAVEIMQKGEVLGNQVGFEDVKGPIRVRLKQK
jgi:hypothetical protein